MCEGSFLGHKIEEKSKAKQRNYSLNGLLLKVFFFSFLIGGVCVLKGIAHLRPQAFCAVGEGRGPVSPSPSWLRKTQTFGWLDQ